MSQVVFFSTSPFEQIIDTMVQWGVYSALLGGVAYAFSPVYRGLTFQFKVFLQVCAPNPMTD